MPADRPALTHVTSAVCAGTNFFTLLLNTGVTGEALLPAVAYFGTQSTHSCDNVRLEYTILLQDSLPQDLQALLHF